MMKLLYLMYLAKWKIEHAGEEFRGMQPPCYREWLDCEYVGGEE